MEELTAAGLEDFQESGCCGGSSKWKQMPSRHPHNCLICNMVIWSRYHRDAVLTMELGANKACSSEPTGGASAEEWLQFRERQFVKGTHLHHLLTMASPGESAKVAGESKLLMQPGEIFPVLAPLVAARGSCVTADTFQHKLSGRFVSTLCPQRLILCPQRLILRAIKPLWPSHLPVARTPSCL